jgi:hypothetical protein
LLLDRLNPQIVSTAIPGTTALAISDTRQWLSQAQCGNAGVLGCDRNGDLIPQHSELGPSPGYTYPTILARYEEGLERPLAHEYMLEFQRVMGPAVFSIDYVMRSTRRNIGQLNTAAPPATYTGPLTVTEVVSGETVEVWNRGTSAVANLFFNDPEVDTDYRGMDITFTKRLDKRWMLMGGATFGKVTSATRGGERNNPNVTNPVEFDRDVMTVDDRPWHLLDAIRCHGQRDVDAPVRPAGDHHRAGHGSDDRPRTGKPVSADRPHWRCPAGEPGHG